MRAVRLFLRARAVMRYVLRSASTLKNADGEQRALRNSNSNTLHDFMSPDYFLSAFREELLHVSVSVETSAKHSWWLHFPQGFLVLPYENFQQDSEHASSSKNFASTSKRALVLFLRAIRAKAKFCEHF